MSDAPENTDAPTTTEQTTNAPPAHDSKVRRSIDDAKSFADNDADADQTATPPEQQSTMVAAEDVPPLAMPRDEQSGRPLKHETVTIDGAPVDFYPSERTNINLKLKTRVAEAEARWVEMCAAHKTEVHRLHQTEDSTGHDRDQKWREFLNGYEWPLLAPRDGRDFIADNNMKSDMANLEEIDADFGRLEAERPRSETSLRTLRHPVNLKAEVQALGQSAGLLCEGLLGDTELSDKVIVPVHHMVFSDEFAFVRSELAKIEDRMKPIMQQLDDATAAKKDAEALEDIPMLESYSFREIELQEELLALGRERLQAVNDANADVENFRRNYIALRDFADERLARHGEALARRMEVIDADMGALADAGERADKANADYEEDHKMFLAANDSEQRTATEEQKSIWRQIMELMAKNQQIAERRKELLLERSERIAQHHKRSAEHESFTEGLDNLSALLTTAKDAAAMAVDWHGSVKDYVGHMCQTIEAKEVDEECLAMRVEEQRAYLDSYATFKVFADDLSLKKETRMTALLRMTRALDVQVRTATQTLDPNKRKYDCELQELAKETEQIREQIAALDAREKVQQEHWKPVEQLLEDEGVDFDPPDLVAEERRLKKKSDAIAEQRRFVAHEQETVDRDTMSLRKLKTSTKVAVEDHKRMKEDRAKQNQIADKEQTTPTKSDDDNKAKEGEKTPAEKTAEEKEKEPEKPADDEKKENSPTEQKKE